MYKQHSALELSGPGAWCRVANRRRLRTGLRTRYHGSLLHHHQHISSDQQRLARCWFCRSTAAIAARSHLDSTGVQFYPPPRLLDAQLLDVPRPDDYFRDFYGHPAVIRAPRNRAVLFCITFPLCPGRHDCSLYLPGMSVTRRFHLTRCLANSPSVPNTSYCSKYKCSTVWPTCAVIAGRCIATRSATSSPSCDHLHTATCAASRCAL